MRTLRRVRRGDTLIEVMFAVAVFSLVAVLSITAMNLGVTNAESALEIAAARSEINAQAEALRFIHSSYVSEKTLPTYDSLNPIERQTEKYQQYTEIWQAIAAQAIPAADFTLTYPPRTCDEVYDNASGPNLLQRNNAFIINVRNLRLDDPAITKDVSGVVVRAGAAGSVFAPSPVNARVLYGTAIDPDATPDENRPSEGNPEEHPIYERIARAEGIWVVAIRSNETYSDAAHTPKYYDFYIETCWYGPSAKSPTALDTVIRLYNPGV